MGLNPRKIRFVRKDTRLKTRSRRSLVSASTCPSITLGDLEGTLPMMVGANDQIGLAVITGGQAPFTLNVSSGSIPDGTALAYYEDSGIHYVAIYGDPSPTAFQTKILTISGTDANDCPITPREYTIKVGFSQTENTPVAISHGAGSIGIDLSSEPALSGVVYGVDAEFPTYKFSVNITTENLTTATIQGSGGIDAVVIATEGDLSGTVMTDTIISNDGSSPLSAGFPPYTGTYYANFSPALNNQSAQQDYLVGCSCSDGSVEGEFTSFQITILPL